jgi:hypothetical protein
MFKLIGSLSVCFLLFLSSLSDCFGESSHVVELSFDDLPTAVFFYRYGHDVDGDGLDDIIFTTQCAPGFQASTGLLPESINHPGLEGNICSDFPEITVEFPGGATAGMRFNFAVPAPMIDHVEAYVWVISKDGARMCEASAEADAGGAGFLEIAIPFEAALAKMQFYSGANSAFIIDDFRVTCYAAMADVGIVEIADSFGSVGCSSRCDVDLDGDIDGYDLAKFTEDFQPTNLVLKHQAGPQL